MACPARPTHSTKSNPPILVVSDRLTIRIHTQFTGHPSATHEVRIAEMDQPANLALLRRIWTAPESFKPRQTNRDITEAAAQSFAALAEGLRQRGSAPGEGATDPQHQQQRANQVAHFLTQCLFCFFAEDVGLLPGRMFERLLNNQQATPERLTQGLTQLFTTMQNGGLYGVDDIPWFNGGLFQTIAVPALSAPDLAELRRAADLNWSAIDVSIFGTGAQRRQRQRKAQRRRGGQRKAQRRFRGRITILRSKTRALPPKPEPRSIPDHKAQPPHPKKPPGPPPTWSSATRRFWAAAKSVANWGRATSKRWTPFMRQPFPAPPTWCATGSTRPAHK